MLDNKLSETYLLQLLHEPPLLLLDVADLLVQEDVLPLQLPLLLLQLQHLVSQLADRPVSTFQLLHDLPVVVAQVVALRVPLLVQLPEDLGVDGAAGLKGLLPARVQTSVIQVFILPQHAVLETGPAAESERAGLLARLLIAALDLVDLIIERGDGLAVLTDPITEGQVLGLDLAPPVFCLVNALAEFLVLLADGLVDLDVVAHVEDVQFLEDSLLLVLVAVHLLLDLHVLLPGLGHRLLQVPRALAYCLQLVLQLLVFLLQLLHRGQDIPDLDIVLEGLIDAFELDHEEALHLHGHFEDAVDELSLVRALQEEVEDQFDDFASGLLLSAQPFVGALHLLALHLQQEVLQLAEVGLEVEAEVVESLEVARVDALQQLVEKGAPRQLLEIVEGEGAALPVPLAVGPRQKVGKTVIICHAILVIKIISTIINRPPNYLRHRACLSSLLLAGGRRLPIQNKRCQFKLQLNEKKSKPAQIQPGTAPLHLRQRPSHAIRAHDVLAGLRLHQHLQKFAAEQQPNCAIIDPQPGLRRLRGHHHGGHRHAVHHAGGGTQDPGHPGVRAEGSSSDLRQKINPGNAFEIPVRVIDPQLTESSNMRFWKFASELLFASMNVYDKRVENMFQTTNRMFDNLIRVQGHPEEPVTEEEAEERHRKQRGELIQMEVGDVGKVETLSSYEIGSINCEEADRINIKNLHNQFLPDPLFHKRLQAFDSNTLRSLFMNAFECDNDLQVTFFNSDNTRKGMKEEEGEVKMEMEAKIEEKEEEETEVYEQRLPKFIHTEIEKFGIDLNPSPIFSEMSNFRKENVRSTLENNTYEVKDFADELKMLQKQSLQNNNQISFFNNSNINNDSEAAQTNSVCSFQQGQNQFNFHFNVSDHTQFSEEQRQDSQSLPNTFAYSQRETTLSEFYFDDKDENNTEMTPWELEFKGLNLQKKKRKNPQNGGQSQRRGPKIQPNGQLEINFLDGKKQIKSKLFARSKNRLSSIKDDFIEANLVPKSMHPFHEAFKRKKMMERSDSFYYQRHSMGPAGSNNNEQNQQNQQQVVEESPPNLDNILNLQQNYQQQTATQRASNFQSNVVHQEHESQGLVYRSTGIRNIREIKQKIYRYILQGRRVRLSELNINVSPSSILIVFLHLVNENNINIISIDGEHDLEISPRLQ